MGYRSDVAYIIAGPKEEILSFVVEQRLLNGAIHKALAECTVGELRDDVLYIGFHTQDVKWYDSYEDVAMHNALWEAAQTIDEFEGIKTIIGEDDNDITNETFGDNSYELWENLSITRCLDIGFGTGPEDDVRKLLKEESCATTPT